MDGFKNTTKTQYSMGGSCAGPRGAAAMSKASKAFRSGGMVEGISSRPKPIPGGDPAVRAAVARGNRVQAEEAAADRLLMRTPEPKPVRKPPVKYKG